MPGAGDQAGAAIPVEVLADEEPDDRAGRVIAGGSGSMMSIAGIAVASFLSLNDAIVGRSVSGLGGGVVFGGELQDLGRGGDLRLRRLRQALGCSRWPATMTSELGTVYRCHLDKTCARALLLGKGDPQPKLDPPRP